MVHYAHTDVHLSILLDLIQHIACHSTLVRQSPSIPRLIDIPLEYTLATSGQETALTLRGRPHQSLWGHLSSSI